MQFIFQQITFVLPAACPFPLVWLFLTVSLLSLRHISKKVELINSLHPQFSYTRGTRKPGDLLRQYRLPHAQFRPGNAAFRGCGQLSRWCISGSLNKEQLINAFYSLALLIIKSTSLLLVPDINQNLDDIYIADLGGQIWHFDYNYDNTTNSGSWSSDPRLVFKANPGSNDDSGETGGGFKNPTDDGRKMFYAPTGTYPGNCNYVDSSGDAHDSKTVMLMVGTGDREKPMATDVHDRIYTIVDVTPPAG